MMARESALARIGAGAGAFETPEALCLPDLDRFKLINAACGHGAGDKALQQVPGRWNVCAGVANGSIVVHSSGAGSGGRFASRAGRAGTVLTDRPGGP